MVDIAAGMYAYSRVLSALDERQREGPGPSSEVSLLNALGEWMSQPYHYAVYGGQALRHASISPYTGNGRKPSEH